MRNTLHIPMYLTTMILLAVVLLLPVNRAQADFNEWTWMSGDKMRNSGGIYGIKGVPHPDNTPGVRSSSVSWMDENGDLWLFGGYGYGEASAGYLNGLWRYNIETDEWTWMSGDKTTSVGGIYGTKGLSHPDNIPGARVGSVSWVDGHGDLWLFGGSGYANNTSVGDLNDLWRYDIEADGWTWMGGDNTVDSVGIYGKKGKPANINTPGVRFNSVSWVDGHGDLWLFGGSGYANNTSYGRLNDLWRYDIEFDEWTWMSGDNTVDSGGIYGTKGLSHPDNIPGARVGSVSWVDERGDLWLFGGDGFDNSTWYSGRLNDLWRYDIESDEWTWMSGDNTVDSTGIYGDKGDPAATNIPGARRSSVSWADERGDLWLFGGVGYDNGSQVDGGEWEEELDKITSSDGSDARLNDLWRYDMESGEWTWMSGERTSAGGGIYGDKGAPADTNTPGSRWDSISWVDQNGDLWLCGGRGYDNTTSYGGLNDLWRYEVLPECVTDIDCDDMYMCDSSLCVPLCELTIKYKALSAEKLLKKDKKLKLIITGDELFDPTGDIDAGDLQILAPKPHTKKGTLKLKLLVPQGTEAQTLPIQVGECIGEIEIQ